MTKLRVGLVGVGSLIQVYHLPNLLKNPRVSLQAICDPQTKKAAAIARRHDIPSVYRDALELFESGEVDAVVIATPTHLHMPYAVQALRNRLHVLIETPAGLNSREVQKIRTEYEKHPDQVIQVGMNNRFRDDVEFVRHSIDASELGRVFYVKAGYLQRFGSGPTASWRFDPAQSGGGVLMDQGVAIIDLMLWMLGYPEVLSVQAELFDLMMGKQVEDTFSARISLEGGCALCIDASWSLLPEQGKAYCYVYGDKGNASLNPLRISRDAGGRRIGFAPVRRQKGAELYKRSYALELDHFIDCALEGKSDPSHLEQAGMVMKVVDALYRSARSGRAVKL